MTDPTATAEPPDDDLAPPPPRRRVAPFVALAVGAVLVGLVAVLATSKGGTVDTAKTPLLGQPAPVVQTDTIDGQPFDLATRKGSWVVLNFFATWCPPCVQEHPELVRFQAAQAAQADGAELVTVVNNDDPSKVKDFFATNGGSWPVLADPGGRVYVSFGVAKVPETWIIDPNGIVVARVVSNITADRLTAIIDGLKQGHAP
jgi:cytochrome c biogenesis protein CcmG, thiol:disulfide interchange protein DsbE